MAVARVKDVSRLAAIYLDVMGLSPMVARGVSSNDPDEGRAARAAMERAEKAARLVEMQFQAMKARGELRSFHREFSAAREAAIAAGRPEPSFSAYLRQRKAQAMRELVREMVRRRGGF